MYLKWRRRLFWAGPNVDTPLLHAHADLRDALSTPESRSGRVGAAGPGSRVGEESYEAAASAGYRQATARQARAHLAPRKARIAPHAARAASALTAPVAARQCALRCALLCVALRCCTKKSCSCSTSCCKSQLFEIINESEEHFELKGPERRRRRHSKV